MKDNVPLDRLKDCLEGLGQDPLEDIIGLMDITGTADEAQFWHATLDQAIHLTEQGSAEILFLFRNFHYCKVSTAKDALTVLHSIRDLYIRALHQ